MNYKKVLQNVEHVVLVALISGLGAFYAGNQYGQSHVDLKSLKTAVNASQVTSK